MNNKFFLLLLGVLWWFPARGAHLIGSELTYECLGDNTYRVTLQIYRDCYSGGADFDSFAPIAIFDENYNLVMVEYAPYPEVEFLEIETGDPCLSAPPDICVEKGVTTVDITLPGNQMGYYLVYQRCCRNGTIQNLVSPEAQGSTMMAFIPPVAIAECNSSPVFDNFPPLVLCANEELVFDHSATDPDGDELIYSLCAPYHGGSQDDPAPNPPGAPPYETILWGATYSDDYPINANPGFTIDPLTGLLIGTPTQIGQYVMGVCVQEFRDGVLISENRRDFQFNITACLSEVEASIEPMDPVDYCTGLTVQFVNTSSSATSFYWDFGDPTTQNDHSELIGPTYTYPDTGVYTVMLVGNPGTECSDTTYMEFPVYLEVEPFFTYPTYQCVDGQQIFEFSASGDFYPSLSSFIWDFGPGATPSNSTDENPSGIIFNNVGTHPVVLTVNQGICESVFESEVETYPPVEVNIHSQDEFCKGYSLQFTQENSGATQFHWDFGVPDIDTDFSNSGSATYTYPGPGIYTVSLNAWNANTCPVSDTEEFHVYPLLLADFDVPPVECFDENSMDFQAGGSFTSQADFEWEFESGSPSISFEQNPSGIAFDETGDHLVQLIINENGCSDTIAKPVRVEPNPVASFDAYQYEGCAPLKVKFINNSITEASSVSYKWETGDGSIVYGFSPVHEYTIPGTYNVKLTVENNTGCEGISESFINNFIQVFPVPKAGFNIAPVPVSVFNPVVEITDLSQGSTNCTYYFLDDAVADQCSFQHTFAVVEPQNVTQIVTNEYGCSATISTFIPFTDHTIFVPNAFTPDGDGLNDIFKPVTLGVIKIQMSIFNRWGERIFYTEELNKGWNGTMNDGDHIVPDGVYSYKIRVTDMQNWNHDYDGHISIIR